jgi:hypothetical protein
LQEKNPSESKGFCFLNGNLGFLIQAMHVNHHGLV